MTRRKARKIASQYVLVNIAPFVRNSKTPVNPEALRDFVATGKVDPVAFSLYMEAFNRLVLLGLLPELPCGVQGDAEKLWIWAEGQLPRKVKGKASNRNTARIVAWIEGREEPKPKTPRQRMQHSGRRELE